MSIWVDEDAKVLIQGITGRQGTFHGAKMVEYGTDTVSYTHLTLPTNREV